MRSAYLARLAFYHLYVSCLMLAPALLIIPARALGARSGNALFVTWLVLNYVMLLILLSRIRVNPTNFVIALAYSAYLLAASLWSTAPSVSLQYSGVLIGTILAACAMASDLSIQEFLAMIARVVFVLALVGLALYAVGVGFAIYVDPANRPNLLGGEPFKGVFPHKIVAGLYASIGIVATLASAGSRGSKTFRVLALLLVVVLTSSSTALVLVPYGVGVYALTRRVLGRRISMRKWIVSLVSVAVVGGALLAWTWNDVLSLLGRDATLTGRTLLWEWGVRTWAEKPLFGWGYAAYFKTSNSDLISQSIDEFKNYTVPHFHQSYIQIAVDFGVIGLIAIIFLLGRSITRSYSRFPGVDESVKAGAFSISLTIATAALVVYIIPSYAYIGFPVLYVFFVYFATRSSRPERHVDPGSLRRSRVRL